ncbi:hypothetical protein NDU88_003915 [Pleurodeles waltl]|uniref:Uncharacterized protein n=1 Tax=Pleurodeles waltl TaxID=8319 RepID=A0AAV7W7H7_PLEWA|nr:hypothetical protein NDU88_003915 [Pleurodeles waltl]
MWPTEHVKPQTKASACCCVEAPRAPGTQKAKEELLQNWPVSESEKTPHVVGSCIVTRLSHFAAPSEFPKKGDVKTVQQTPCLSQIKGEDVHRVLARDRKSMAIKKQVDPPPTQLTRKHLMQQRKNLQVPRALQALQALQTLAPANHQEHKQVRPVLQQR